MTELRVSAPGAARLGRDLDRAASAIDVDDLVQDVATPIAARAAAAAPRLTGAMARAIRVDNTGVVVDVDRYPLMVHNGTRFMAARPFITQAIRPAEVEQLATQHLNQALTTVGTSYV